MDKAARKLALLEKKLDEQGKLSAQEVREMGKSFARTQAPHNSGRLISLIQLPKTTGSEAVIVSKNPKGNRIYPEGKVKNFNLVRWMHKTGGKFQSDNPFGKAGTQHIKTGDPRYMYSTRDYLIMKGVPRVRAQYNKVVAQINNT